MNSKRQDRLILVKPSEQSKDDVLAYRDEFIQSKDSMHGSGDLENAASFEEWLRKACNNENEKTVQEGRVPASEYLAVRESDGRLVGMMNIRHRLNDALRFEGGHIGFSVRKSERRKGYATQMLREALSICE